MVFYRTYRSQTIEELDSDTVRKKLYAVLTDPQKVPHAFLFTGPKGLGKTSAARIVAKAVNCVGKKSQRGASGIEPCNTCEQCTAITNGTSMDVLEIDAASNRGIDEIRDLKEKIKLAPLTAAKKVYIIDEVHMLTTEAFNALLKTLEEPPVHAMFILCTTEPQKVPATILSRTFHITFQKATYDELLRSFARIVKAEKISITHEALQRIAQLSDGGFRDGIKVLEELFLASGGKKITPEMIDERYQLSGSTLAVETLITYLTKRKTKEALTLINTIVTEGSDIKYIFTQVLERLHQELLQKVGVLAGDSDVSPLSLVELRQLLLLLTQAMAEVKHAVLPQLPFELAVIEWGEQARNNTGSSSVKASHLAQATRDKSEGQASQKSSRNGESVAISVSTLRKQAGNIRKVQALYGEKEEKKPKIMPLPPADMSVLQFSAKGEITPEWLQTFWSAIIQDVKQHNHTLAGVLRGCMMKSFDRQHLVIETPYTFHHEKLNNGQTKQILESICRNLTGNSITVTVELRDS